MAETTLPCPWQAPPNSGLASNDEMNLAAEAPTTATIAAAKSHWDQHHRRHEELSRPPAVAVAVFGCYNEHGCMHRRLRQSLHFNQHRTSSVPAAAVAAEAVVGRHRKEPHRRPAAPSSPGATTHTIEAAATWRQRRHSSYSRGCRRVPHDEGDRVDGSVDDSRGATYALTPQSWCRDTEGR